MLLGATTASTEALVTVAADPRLCARRCCGAPALDDAELCEPHDDAEKERVASAVQRGRDRRRAAGECRDCGAKCAKPTRDPSAPYPRCKACRILAGRFMAQSTAVVTRMVTAKGSHSTRISMATRVDGTGRTRFHGQQKRGKPSMATTNTATMDLIDRECREARAAVLLAFAAETDELPRIQRYEARHAALALWKLAAREILDMCVKNGVEVDDVKPSSDE